MSTEGDLVLVHVEDSPAFFARIECISPDVKPNWYQVSLLVLQVPLVEVTWILKEEYIKGASFTMGGKRVVIERVVAPPKALPPDEDRKSQKYPKKKPIPDRETGKVISMFERK
jgi:hypothetical protein